MYKNFRLTDNERKEIMESHKSHGYKKPLNELGDKEIGVVRGKPDLKLKTGRPVGDYADERAAAKQFQQDFKRDFPDPGIEDVPFWEKDQATPSGDSIDDRKLSDEVIEKRKERERERKEKEREYRKNEVSWHLRSSIRKINNLKEEIEYIVNRVSEQNSDMFEKIAELMTSEAVNNLDNYGLHFTEYVRFKNEFIELTGDEVEQIRSPKEFIKDLLRSNL